MGKKKTKPRKPTLQKETVRKLDHAALSTDDLARVAGGDLTVARQTTACSA